MNSPLSRDEFEAKLKYHTELATGLEKGRMEHTPERAELLKFHREQREWIINRLKQTGSTDAFLILRGREGPPSSRAPLSGYSSHSLTTQSGITTMSFWS